MNVTFSNHANRVMRSRHVTRSQVMMVITRYYIRHSATRHNGRTQPDVFMYKRENLTVVAHEDGNELHVITVLLNTPEQWTDADARDRLNANQARPDRRDAT